MRSPALALPSGAAARSNAAPAKPNWWTMRSTMPRRVRDGDAMWRLVQAEGMGRALTALVPSFVFMVTLLAWSVKGAFDPKIGGSRQAVAIFGGIAKRQIGSAPHVGSRRYLFFGSWPPNGVSISPAVATGQELDEGPVSDR